MSHRPPCRPLMTAMTAAALALGSWHAAGAQAPYQVAPPKNGGSVEGHITLPGPVPPIPPFKTTKNQDICGKTVPNPKATVVDPATHGVAWAVVYLETVAAGRAPADEYVLANKGCTFVPHVVAAVAGKTFVLENKDPVIHNTHIRFTSRTLLNTALSFHEGDPQYHPIKDQRVLLKPGLLNVKCDEHEWMAGFIQVFPNPYFAVTAADGSYKIADVPPGTYNVGIWHENLGEKTQKVTVAPGAAAKLDFAFAGK